MNATLKHTKSAIHAGDFKVADLSLADFGRTEPEFTWERTDRAAALADEAKGIRAA